MGGFTLVEVLIGATLGIMVLGAVLSSYIFLGRQLARLANMQTLETEGRRALGYFTQDVQKAIGISGTPSASAVTLTIPTNTGATTTVAYSFTNDTGGNGTFTRTPSGGTAQTLVRYIINNGLTISFFDSSGNPYSAYTDYLPGIKQLALEFSTQTGNAGNGTRTPLNVTTSNRIVMRNKPFLP